MADITNRSVSSFLNNEVKEFARYVLETRCCPKLSDGLRTGARKAIASADDDEKSDDIPEGNIPEDDILDAENDDSVADRDDADVPEGLSDDAAEGDIPENAEDTDETSMDEDL